MKSVVIFERISMLKESYLMMFVTFFLMFKLILEKKDIIYFYKKNEPNNHGLIFCLALLLRTSERKHYFRVSGLVINQFSSLMFVISEPI